MGGASTCTSEDSTQSSGEVRMFSSRRVRESDLELDEDGRVKPYVDFSEFFQAFQVLSEEQKASLLNEMRPKSMYDPIQEESEPISMPDQ
jgi:hypothetical protein